MNSKSFFFVMTLLISQVFSQGINGSYYPSSNQETRKTASGKYITEAQAQAKVDHYTKLKQKGARRSIIGGSLTLVSIIMLASSDWETETTEYGVEKTTNSPQGVIGGVMLMPAIPITIVGLVQLGIGSSKVEEYSNLFADTQTSLLLGRDKIGLQITHSF